MLGVGLGVLSQLTESKESRLTKILIKAEKQKKELDELVIKVTEQSSKIDVFEKEYKDLLNKMPTSVDWNKLSEYEKSDMTVGSQELACSAGSCEIQ